MEIYSESDMQIFRKRLDMDYQIETKIKVLVILNTYINNDFVIANKVGVLQDNTLMF